MTKATAPTSTMTIPPLLLAEMCVTLVGDTPLIVHAWSEKAKKEMLDKQMKAAKAGKTAKDPQADYLSSLYVLPGDPPGYGFPTVAFKAAAVTACTSIDGVTKVAARQAFHILGELVDVPMVYGDGKTMRADLVRIIGEPEMREDMVRVGMGTADLRYRGQFWPWSVVLRIRWNTTTLSVQQILNLLNTAGFGVGIGEWRPEKDGTNGMFHVSAHEMV